jgi:hypothetical protein
MWPLAVLHGLPDHGHARRPQELVKLREVVALGQRGDAERALLRAACLGAGVVGVGLDVASVP